MTTSTTWTWPWSSAQPTPRPHVVVLGGGFAGVTAAKALERTSRVTLVSDRDFLFIKFGALRAGVAGGAWIDRALVPLDRVLKAADSAVVKGRVVGVDPTRKRVTLEDGRALEYDALVCATGSRALGASEPPSSQTTRDEFKAWFASVRAAVAAAGSIVVVGGGPVGLELAGELRAFAGRDKRIALVTGKAGVLGRVSPLPSAAFLDAWRDKLAANDVRLVEDDVRSPALDRDAAFVRPASGRVELASGETIEADLVLFGVGVEPRASFYPADWRDPVTGGLLVEPTLQVKGQPYVFAAGDVAASGRLKVAFLAGQDAEAVAANVAAVLSGRAPSKTVAPLTATVMSVPFGPEQGVSLMPFGFVMGDWFTALIKGRGLFEGRAWKTYAGENAPEV